MSKEIMVYFNSGNKARIDLDSTWFLSADKIDSEYVEKAISLGQIIVVSDNVSFIRDNPPKKEECDE